RCRQFDSAPGHSGTAERRAFGRVASQDTSPIEPMRMFVRFAGTLTVAGSIALAACGGENLRNNSRESPPTGTVPQFAHVFIVVEENADYAKVVGNSAMPYLNSLASRYGLATQYYANTHPSIGNYFMLTVG